MSSAWEVTASSDLCNFKAEFLSIWKSKLDRCPAHTFEKPIMAMSMTAKIAMAMPP